MSFSFLQIFQKPNEFFSRITALVSKKRSNKRKGQFRILFWFSCTTFLICRNPAKNFVGFLEDLKTPKGHFEIKWPLAKFERSNRLRILLGYSISSAPNRNLSGFKIYAVTFILINPDICSLHDVLCALRSLIHG